MIPTPAPDDAPTLEELAELLERDAPPVADLPFTLTAPPHRTPRPTAPPLPFGDDK